MTQTGTAVDAILAMLRQRAAVTELALNEANNALVAANQAGSGWSEANLVYRAAYAAAMEAGDAYRVAVRLANR